MSDPDPTRDPLISQHEEAALDADRAANLFDLRRMIGGLFLIYGVILVILGIGADDAEIEKAAGWNLNLYVGIAMLVVAALFLIWAFMRPLAQQLGAEQPADAAPSDSEATRGTPRGDLGRPGE